MSHKLLRPCQHPGCCALVTGRYCAEHQRDTRSAESQSWHGWYSRRIWTERLRAEQLMLHPWCAACAARGIRRRATDVDHIVPHDGDWQRFCDPANLQSLCHQCHSRKTMAESRAKAR